MIRAFQQRFVEHDLPAAWRSGYRNVILALPPGAGKTRCARLTIERLLAVGGWDVWFRAHRRELVEQAATELRHLNPSLYLVGKPSPRPSTLCIAGRDTLARRDFEPINQRCFIVNDEHHHGSCDTDIKLNVRFAAKYKIVYILGLTATPYTLSGRPIPGDVIIEPVTPAELFEAGTILEPRVIGLEGPDMRGAPVRSGDFLASDLEQRTAKLVGNMVEEAKRWHGGFPFTVRAVSVADSKMRVERLRAAGFRAEHLDGETPAALRDELLARLAIGGQRGSSEGIDCIVRAGNPDLIGEGWNNPSDYERVLRLRHLWAGKSYPPPFVPVSMLSDCAPTMSMCLYRQAECRINRPNGDSIETSAGPMPAVPKEFCVVVSHSENWRRHGLLRDHHGFPLNEGEPRGIAAQRDKRGLVGCRYCPACLSVWPSSSATCSCGAALTTPKTIDETDEPLAEVKRAPVEVPTETARAALLANVYRSQLKKRGAALNEKQVAAIFWSMTGKKKWPSSAEMAEARRRAADGQ